MKNFRGITIALVLMLFGAQSFAQDSTGVDECAKWRGLYFQYLKQKMYRDAGTMWGKAVKACGEAGLDDKFFVNGRVIYSKLMSEHENDAAILPGLQDTMSWIYESKMKHGKDSDWELDYAVYLMGNKDERYGKLDTLFENVHILKEKTKSTAIKQYFIHLILNKFNKASQEEKEDIRTYIIEEYIVLSEYCGAAIKAAKEAADEKDEKRYESAQQFLDKYFLKIAQDCEVLTPVLDKKFEKIPEGEAGLKALNKFIALMEKQKCTDSETYGKYVEESVKRNPTAAGYAGLGVVQLNKGQKSEAVESFKKAVELEGDGDDKNKYLLALCKAQYTARQYRAAFSTGKSVDGDEKGEALKICADAVAASANDCGESTFARKANYWLANDYINRAISAGYSGVSSSKYLDSAPSSNDVFTEGLQMGSSYSLSCWGESTTIR